MSRSDRPVPLLPAGTGALAPFVEAGVLAEPGIAVAGAVARTVEGTSDEVLLAVALCVRALQLGHVCVEIDRVADTVGADTPDDLSPPDKERAGSEPIAVEDLPWPDPARWATALRASASVTERDPISGEATTGVPPDLIRPLVFDGTRVYLERYWRYERQIGDTLLTPDGTTGDTRGDSGMIAYDEVAIDAVLDRYFGPDKGDEPDLQRRGARVALRRRITVVAGGPGTGKTHTVARLLACVHQLALDAGHPIEVALAAPTGKAAARMTEAVHQAVDSLATDERTDLPEEVADALRATEGRTIHRLLGWRDGIAFRHDAANPLPHDLVVIDETSMVALPLMARLLDALRPNARLVLVGDPFQLASVEAGAVLGDIVGPAARSSEPVDGPMADGIVVLERVHRFATDSAIAALAAAVRSGDADAAIEVLRDPGATEVTWINPDDATEMAKLRGAVVANTAEVARAARDGDTEDALARSTEVKVLCGTRFGPQGSYQWRDHIERQLPRLVKGMNTDSRWYLGRPVIITRNDEITGVFNGDTGLVVQQGDGVVVAMAAAQGIRTFLPSQLDALETWWAMTIHKSQGSEFTHAVVSLPGARSRVLTNELLYTGITRGREAVTLIAREDALRTAIGRRIARASGLQDRLWP